MRKIVRPAFESIRNPVNGNKPIVPIVLSTAIAGVTLAAIAAPGESERAKSTVSPESEPIHSRVFNGTSEFGDSESGWGQGAAERAIRSALEQGIPAALDQSMTKAELSRVIKDLPIYDQAGDALEIAYSHDEYVSPDVGDQLDVWVDVEADAKHKVSYKVVDAKITDLPNNQE